MKRNFYLLIIVLTFVRASAIAQQSDYQLYYHGGAAYGIKNPQGGGVAPNSSGQSGTGANINVVYHRVYWRIAPDSAKGISGNVTTYFKTLVANVSSITMDLRQSSFNNASLVVLYHGITCTRSVSAANILTITLPSTIVASGTLDSLTVHYRGVPPGVVGAAQGYQNDTDPTTGQNVTNTLSESYEDRDWWPCKADMQDKIDSMDIFVNVPWGTPTAADTFWVATNGKLVDSTIAGGNRTFKYKTRYPIASYLVCVAVARFNRYYRGVNVSGVNTQVAYYLHRGKSAGNYTTILNAMDVENQVLAAFSAKFGDYPYKYDKHGFYDGLKGAGGMEHQTFSAIDGGTTAGSTGSLASYSVLSHELTHQWFGDKATFATWADIYLAEGFARYGESLAGELVPATGISPTAIRNAAKTSARSIATTPTRITSFATSAAVWGANNVSAMYDRGCMVVAMLRALSGDNNFFLACRNYLDSLNGSGYKSATTDSLKNNFSRVLGGYDLTPFFNDWVIGVGHPSTVVNWAANATNKKFYLSVASQTRSAGATATYFHNVIVVRVQGALPVNDTTIVFYDIDGNNLAKAGNGISAATPGNVLSYDLSFVATTVTFDPFFQTMSNGSIVPLAALAVDVTNFTAQKSNSGNDIRLTLSNNEPVSRVVLQKSADGINFSDAGDMLKLNNTGSEINYQFTDMAPFAVNTFYRAKIFNAVKEQYTAIVKVKESSNTDVSVSPSPANDMVNISFTNTSREKLTIHIVSAEGKVVAETFTNNDFLHYNVSNLATGMYLVQVIKQGQVNAAIKFMVRH